MAFNLRHDGAKFGRVDRRHALRQIAGLGAIGAGISRCWPLEAALAAMPPAARPANQIKSCILLFYYGGPSHLDTWDMKPDAPAEVRGEFRPISTRVAGLSVSEHLPRCAKVMDKVAIVRSLHHGMRNHNSAAVEALCGRTPTRGDQELLADDANGAPCYGAALSFLSPHAGSLPTHVALPHVMYNVVELPGQKAGFLGPAYNPLQITRDPSAPHFKQDELELSADMSPARLEERRLLLAQLDAQSRRSERSGAKAPLQVFQERAFELLRSDEVRQAFDLESEPVALRERYGRNRLGQSLLLARRMVEAGVRFVNVNDRVRNGQLANWDSHQNNFGRLKDELLPPADQGFAALIEDLEARGLLDSTLIVALGEFGRTPTINRFGGRDHWPDCFSAVLAGGGIQGGRVYGSSDRMGAYPDADPVTPGDLAATIFQRFGLDPGTELHDLTGRPFRLAAGQPLVKLFGGSA